MTKSQIKADAVIEYFLRIDGVLDIFNVDCDACGLPPQPIGDGYKCAEERYKFATKSITDLDTYYYIVSIENTIDIDKCVDVAYVVIRKRKEPPLQGTKIRYGKSFEIEIPKEVCEKLVKEYPLISYNDEIKGYNKTIGEILADEDDNINPKNWMSIVSGIDRKDQIIDAIENAFQI